ncbi:UNVERIFIED_CONTAM: hypothetical protein Sangu_2447800, partial [Sesamum angustifolium]
MGFEGEMFTWCNRREASHTVRARSGRACCNSCWAYLFQLAKVPHENFACSDHAAVSVHMPEVTNLASVKKQCRFHFEVAWFPPLSVRMLFSKLEILSKAWFLKKQCSTKLSEETIERVLANMENRAIDAMNADLTRPFSLEEIMRGLNQMHPLKSPDPN